MRRWPAILLCLVLFAAAMLVVRAVLGAGLPFVLNPAGELIGWPALVALMFLGGFTLLTYGLWPRDAQGRMKPLSRR